MTADRTPGRPLRCRLGRHRWERFGRFQHLRICNRCGKALRTEEDHFTAQLLAIAGSVAKRPMPEFTDAEKIRIRELAGVPRDC